MRPPLTNACRPQSQMTARSIADRVFETDPLSLLPGTMTSPDKFCRQCWHSACWSVTARSVL